MVDSRLVGSISRISCCALILVAGLALPATAEIYKWTDASGRMHFTQELHQVPARYRRQAEAGAQAATQKTSSKLHTYPKPAPAASMGRSSALPGSLPADGKLHRIRVQRAGTTMLVNVRLNNSLVVPFYVDTGASDVSVPRWAVDQLGIDLAGARTKRYSTANGVIEKEAFVLRSVQLGGARVDDVPASVSDSMQVGLLGLSFFNHFTYNVDAAAGTITLSRNRLVETGAIRGGRSEAQWRSEFHHLRARLDWVEQEYENRAEAKARSRRRLLAEKAELERQFALLEVEADRARVPMSWRQ
jgi:aspartyl protease family protein